MVGTGPDAISVMVSKGQSAPSCSTAPIAKVAVGPEFAMSQPPSAGPTMPAIERIASSAPTWRPRVSGSPMAATTAW